MCICQTLDSILSTNKKIKIKDVVDKTEYVQIKEKKLTDMAISCYNIVNLKKQGN